MLGRSEYILIAMRSRNAERGNRKSKRMAELVQVM
jgi:hypothetical protein